MLKVIAFKMEQTLNMSIKKLVSMVSQKYGIPKATLQKLVEGHFKAPVLSRLKELKQTEHIKRNGYGMYEHAPTGLIFNKDTKVVIGRHDGCGNMEALEAVDVEVCLQYKFAYVLPENLESKFIVNHDADDNEIEKEIEALLLQTAESDGEDDEEVC